MQIRQGRETFGRLDIICEWMRDADWYREDLHYFNLTLKFLQTVFDWAYAVHPGYVSTNEQTLASWDLDRWDQQLPRTLQELCVETLARNWKERPILDEIVLATDRYLLLDILDTDLPLKLTVPKIPDDVYWRKCYLNRWLNVIPCDVNSLECYDIVKGNSSRKLSIASTNSSGGNSKNGKSSRRHSRDSKISNNKILVDKEGDGSSKKRTWKEHYLERHLKGYLEHLIPEEYDAEKIKELSDLCSPYIKILRIDQLQSSENSPSSIPLNSILAGFQNLRELTICFKQTYGGEKFSWDLLTTPTQDIKLLGKGLEKLRLHTLRIENSDINCEKLIIILKSLLKHDLSTIDFSHCKIADKGALAMSKFSLDVPVKEIILANNRIGSKGAEYFSYALHQNSCQISTLDLQLNKISDDGGNCLFKAVINGSKSLKSLTLSGCGFSGHISIERMLQTNKSLESLDISNNNMGEDVGEQILKAMEFNTTLKKIDLRMTRISSETEFEIQESIQQNRKLRKKPKEQHAQIDEENVMNEETAREFELILQ